MKKSNIIKTLSAVLLTVSFMAGNIYADETTTTAASTSETQEVPVTNEKGELTINGSTFETMYGSQLGTYLDHQYHYDMEEIPIAESNFYFIHTFTDMSQSALVHGYYPLTSEGFVDLAFELPEGQTDNFSFSIFGDYFREFAENQLLSTYIVLDMAEEKGLTLDDDTMAQIDDYMVTLSDIAKEQGLTIDQYLKIFYGKDCDEESFRGILERYYLSSLFSDDYIKNYEFTDEELYVPHVCHIVFGVSAGADSATAAESKQRADDFLASCTSVNDILIKGQPLVEEKLALECSEYSVVKDRFVKEFEDWAYDENRKEGDMEVIKTDYGYHVIGYMGVDEIDDDSKTEIALRALNDEVGSIAMTGVHEFYTDEAFENPPVVTPAEGEPAVSEPITSLPLDEEGNITLETTTEATEAQITAEPMKTSKELSMTRKVTIALAITVVAAIVIVVIVLVVKSKKTQDSIIKAAAEEKTEENPKEADE